MVVDEKKYAKHLARFSAKLYKVSKTEKKLGAVSEK